MWTHNDTSHPAERVLRDAAARAMGPNKYDEPETQAVEEGRYLEVLDYAIEHA
jgi:hypothetical protein